MVLILYDFIYFVSWQVVLTFRCFAKAPVEQQWGNDCSVSLPLWARPRLVTLHCLGRTPLVSSKPPLTLPGTEAPALIGGAHVKCRFNRVRGGQCQWVIDHPDMLPVTLSRHGHCYFHACSLRRLQHCKSAVSGLAYIFSKEQKSREFLKTNDFYT